MRLLIAITLATLLTGCVTAEQQLAQDQAYCKASGMPLGTCIPALQAQRDEQQRQRIRSGLAVLAAGAQGYANGYRSYQATHRTCTTTGSNVGGFVNATTTCD